MTKVNGHNHGSQVEIIESRAPTLICNLNVEIEFLKKFSEFTTSYGVDAQVYKELSKSR
jgi:hypothetical protein